MSQPPITKQRRTASTHWRGQVEPLLPWDPRDAWDPRDPAITRARQLQHQPPRAGTRRSGDDLRAVRGETSP